MKWILTSFSFSIVICYHPLIALLFTLGKIDITILVFLKMIFEEKLALAIFELKSVSVNNWINWTLHQILSIIRIFQINWWIWYFQIFYKKFQYLNSKKSNKSSGNSAVAIVNRDDCKQTKDISLKQTQKHREIHKSQNQK